MADVELVIKIPEDRYRDIQRIASVQMVRRVPTIEQIVADGTPLPKGHGRLIDADKLEPRDISPEAWYSPMWGFELVDIDDAPTIIEADKAESEDKLSWLGKNCKDCGNEKCKKLGTLPKGYDCALWQKAERNDKE